VATVVLLHPFPQDSSFWHEVAGAVRAAGHEVMTPDLPGFGGRALEPGWTIAGEADRLAGDIPAGSAVVGLSMGGYLALALLAAHPDRIGSLVLADTRAAAEAPDGMATRRTTAETLRRDGSAAFLDGFVPRALGPSPDPQVVARLRAIADRQPAEAMADATMAIATRDDHTALLPGITVPTLLVVGEHDAVTTPAEHTEMAAAIPGATLAIIGGAGHMTALEQPAEFADLVLAHISA
jgi:pimeloyl-ACP methyl ester carboxylesterase